MPTYEDYSELVEKIPLLSQHPRYEAAFVFGSFANQNMHARSDIDLVVIVEEGQPTCESVSHPLVNEIRFDISFNTLAKIAADCDAMLKSGVRKPWLCDSLILFDKRGRLQELKDRVVEEAKPRMRDREDVESIQFEVYYHYTKPGKYLNTDPETANLIMHMGIKEILRLHYSLQGRWWVSDKHLLGDLQQWDPPLHATLLQFLRSVDLEQKYRVYREMIEHVLIPVGGKDFRRLEGNCSCEKCQADLAIFNGLFGLS